MKKQHDEEPGKATFYRGFKIITFLSGAVQASLMYGTNKTKRELFFFESIEKATQWINGGGFRLMLSEIVKTHNIATTTNGHDARREHGELIKVLADIIGE